MAACGVWPVDEDHHVRCQEEGKRNSPSGDAEVFEVLHFPIPFSVLFLLSCFSQFTVITVIIIFLSRTLGLESQYDFLHFSISS